jgi:methionyl-tRNA formyltransferase
MAKKIVFMGTPMFAVPILKSLYQNGYPISDVYTQPPQKSQRGQKINKSPIQGIAETLNLDFRTPKYLKDNKEEYEYFQSIDADLAIVVAYGQIIPKEFLTLTKKGFINIHASLLPKWRGAAPIQRSIMNLDTETGVSIMKIAEELDTGPVCNTYKINLENNLNASDVADKLSLIAAEKILDNIDNILEDRVKFIDQDHSKATYVVCGDKQTIKIKEIQRQGKKPQNIGEFMLGSQIKQGTVI